MCRPRISSASSMFLSGSSSILRRALAFHHRHQVGGYRLADVYLVFPIPVVSDPIRRERPVVPSNLPVRLSVRNRRVVSQCVSYFPLSLKAPMIYNIGQPGRKAKTDMLPRSVRLVRDRRSRRTNDAIARVLSTYAHADVQHAENI